MSPVVLVDLGLDRRAVELEERGRAAQRMVGHRPPCAPRRCRSISPPSRPEAGLEHVEHRSARGPGGWTTPRSTRTGRPRQPVEPGRHRAESRLDLATGGEDGVAHQDGRAARRGLLVVGHDGRVAHHDGDPVERRPELLARRSGRRWSGRPGPCPTCPRRPRRCRRRAGATVEYDRPVVGPDLIPRAMPRPCPAGSGVSQPIELGGPADGLRPVAVAGRVERDERVAPAGQVAQPDLERVDAQPPGRLVEVRLDRPVDLRVAEPAERGRRHGVRQDAPGDDPRGRHPVRAARRCSCPCRRRGRRCRRTRRSGSPPRCPGRRACRRCGGRSGPGPRPPFRRTAWNVSSRVSTRRTGRPTRERQQRDAAARTWRAACRRSRRPDRARTTRTFASGSPSSAGDHLLEPVRVLDRCSTRRCRRRPARR